MNTLVPILTIREQELARLLIDGFSASQISELLNISRNTVNDHCKSIYRKFHSTNLKECFLELVLYISTYDEKYKNFEFATVTSKNTMRIVGKDRVAHFSRLADCICLRREMECYTEEVYSSGGIPEVKLDGRELSHEGYLRGSYLFKYRYENILKYGDRFTRKAEITFHGCHNDRENYWSTKVTFPAFLVENRVSFDPVDPPNSVRLETIDGANIREIELNNESDGSFIFEAVTPPYGSLINFHWEY